MSPFPERSPKVGRQEFQLTADRKLGAPTAHLVRVDPLTSTFLRFPAAKLALQ